MKNVLKRWRDYHKKLMNMENLRQERVTQAKADTVIEDVQQFTKEEIR